MNKKNASLLAIAAIAFSSVFFTSCKKENADSDVEAAENNSLSESVFNDVTTLVDQSVNYGAVSMGLNGGSSVNDSNGVLGSNCATVSLDTTSATRTVIIDFGTANCLCNDGRYRRGKIKATYTGRYRNAGTVITTTFENYYVNDNQVKGTKKVTNAGSNAAGNLVYTVEVNGELIKANNSGTVTWISNRQREWLAGENTPLVLTDDVYSITGSSSGVNVSGTGYSVVIKQPLVRAISCRWFQSGKLDITPQGKLTRTLDYGSTGCDDNATVTIAGRSFPITLK